MGDGDDGAPYRRRNSILFVAVSELAEYDQSGKPDEAQDEPPDQGLDPVGSAGSSTLPDPTSAPPL